MLGARVGVNESGCGFTDHVQSTLINNRDKEVIVALRKSVAVVAATLFSLTLAGCFGGAPATQESTVPQESSGPVRSAT